MIVSGPVDGPPVVLLHALFATAASWYRNVEALSRTYRTYCVDVIGEANKSRPSRPSRRWTTPGVVHRADRPAWESTPFTWWVTPMEVSPPPTSR